MPRVQMTPMVRIALYGLSAYLIVLLVLVAIKFYRVVTAPKNHTADRAAPTAKAGP